MKTLVLYYSYTGKTKTLAEAKAAELGAEIEAVIEVKRPSTLAAYTGGGLRAIRRKGTPIQPVKAKLEDYDKIVLMSPVWAGRPAPAVNSAIQMLPPNKKVEIIMVSASGKTGKNADGTKALVYGRGCEILEYIDVKG